MGALHIPCNHSRLGACSNSEKKIAKIWVSPVIFHGKLKIINVDIKKTLEV